MCKQEYNRYGKVIVFLITIFGILSGGPLSAQESSRKKVAVVLSGGGAKGTAHVKALQVIEEAGIPIDMIVGTSMGSIVGGLYAMGYTTHQLDSLIREQDWKALLTDRVPRSRENLLKKLNTERYVISIPYENTPSEVLEGGILKGRNIGRLFSDLTAGLHDSIDFRNLPIPFACVAVDLSTGEEVVFKSGILAECMRASMSIPGVFTPVRKDGMVLVDGGLANNYPADVAREMGADIIIGIDVTNERERKDKLSGMNEILMRIIDLACENKYEENVNLTDIHIKVNVKGYSSASFSNAAIDTLMQRGETAARNKWDELMILKERIGNRTIPERQPLSMRSDTLTTPVNSIMPPAATGGLLNFGARFDTEELASLLLGASYRLSRKNESRISLEARLGRRSYGKIELSFRPFEKWNISTAYQLSYDELKIYHYGHRIGEVSYLLHQANLEFSRSWREVRISFGGRFTSYNFSDILTQDDWNDVAQPQKHENGINYYARMQFDNQDNRIYPHQGMKWSITYNYFTDNAIGYNHRAGLHIVEGWWEGAIPLSSRLTLTPSVSGRIVPKRNEYLSNINFIGGIGSYGHFLPQQLPFAGVNYVEFMANDLLITGLSVRQRLTTNNYIFGLMNYGLTGSDMEGLITEKKILGAAIGYGYSTPFGPIEAHFNWSNQTQKVAFFFNVGYMF